MNGHIPKQEWHCIYKKNDEIIETKKKREKTKTITKHTKIKS